MAPSTALILLLSIVPGGFAHDARADSHGPAGPGQPPRHETSAATNRDDPSSAWRLHIADPYVRDAARRSLEGAAHWVSFLECQQLLVHFVDEGGRPLHRKLGGLGVTAAEYLRLIVFEDGTNRGRCRQRGILAFTTPGSRVIYLCGRDFMRAAQRTPEDVRAVIIHEMLHSLGLGEDPPSSREITSQVRQRCWR